ncbi:MAG: hypothetical protein HQL38_11665 [Alphaproteobacteria bacterium]|nr:hypothetical protein [Alphaproteobacteria bacterium]
MSESPVPDGTADWLFSRLPDEVIDSFSPEQRAALYHAAKSPTWRRYPVNIRLSIPALTHRYFLTVVSGRERRNPDRIHREKAVNPVGTFGNMLFLMGVGALFYVMAVLALLAAASIVEF